MATIQASDVLPVRSRVSWGAILAGAFVALALYIVLMVGGAALGLTLSDQVRSDNLARGAGIWAAVAMLISLFVGGCVASRISVGENKTEAAIYGVVVWGAFFFLVATLTAGTVNMGFNALRSATGAAQAVGTNRITTQDLEKIGISKAEIDRVQEKLRNPQVSEEDLNAARENTKAAAWWTFVGMVLSLAAAVGGALLGAGPNLVITSLRVRAAVVPELAEREVVAR